MVTIRLTYPPSLNRYLRTFRGRQVRSAEANRYKFEAAYRAKQSGMELLSGKVAVYVNLHPKTRKKESKSNIRCIDLDNCCKVALDALQGIAYEDDRQVELMVLKRCEPVQGGALVLSVGRLEE